MRIAFNRSVWYVSNLGVVFVAVSGICFCVAYMLIIKDDCILFTTVCATNTTVTTRIALILCIWYNLKLGDNCLMLIHRYIFQVVD